MLTHVFAQTVEEKQNHCLNPVLIPVHSQTKENCYQTTQESIATTTINTALPKNECQKSGSVLRRIAKFYFSCDGRLGRKQYFWGLVVLYIALCITGLVIVIFNQHTPVYISFLSYFVLIPFTILGIKRSHDTDRAGWFAALLYLPIACLYAIFILFFIKGTDGANKYGLDPVKS